MATESGKKSKISIQCGCGQFLAAPASLAGKTMACPSCHRTIVVPHQEEPSSPPFIKYLWSLVAGLTVAAVIFAVILSRNRERAQVAAADAALSSATAAANTWISAGDLRSADKVESDLIEALANERSTNRGNGESVLRAVQDKRKERLELAALEQAEKEATAIFDRANEQIIAEGTAEAIVLLQEYLAHPHATRKPEAGRLLAEARLSTSDKDALADLVSMDENTFTRFRRTETLNDGKVTSPALKAVRIATYKQNLEEALQTREEIKTRERQKQEAVRLAIAKRQRKEESERLAEESRKKLAEQKDRQRDAKARFSEITPVLGHWHSDDGKEIYVDVKSHLVILDDGTKPKPLIHKTTRKVIFPAKSKLDTLSNEEQKALGDLMERLGKVRLVAFGTQGQASEDHPGAEFFIIETEPFQILNKHGQITDVFAIVNGQSDRAEFVQLLTLDGKERSDSQTIRRIDARRTPN